MKTTNNKQSFLATCSKKHFKMGLLLSLAFTIVAFKIPFYSSTPKLTISDPYEVDVFDIEDITSFTEKKAPPIDEVINNQIQPKLITVDFTPKILDKEDKTEFIDPEDFNLPPETRVIETDLPKIKKVKAQNIADVMPEYIGGERELFEYIKENTTYSRAALDINIEGKVYVRFIVDKNGKVKEAEVVKSAHPLLDKEALKVVKSMPNWNPGVDNGQKVDVYMVIPINFVIG